MAKAKNRHSVEYRLLITPHFNELRQMHTTLFLIETVQAFASFRYELSVKEEIDGKLIRYKILGLKAPQLNLPAAGHAQFRREYEGLTGTYTLVVEGIDGRVNEFLLKISAKKAHLLKSPRNQFVEISVKEPTSTQ